MELRIKEILRQKGLKMADLADRIGTDQSNLQKSLKGNPTLERLQEVAAALEVNVHELLSDSVPSSPVGVVSIGGKTYGLIETPTVVQIISYSDYSRLRKDIEEFVKDCLNNKSTQSIMGRVESFEIFALSYTPYEKVFLLSMCYGEGNMITIRYDVDEYADAERIDREYLIQEIVNDVEGAVSLKKERDADLH